MTPQEELQKVTEERDALRNEIEALQPYEAGFSTNFSMAHEKVGTQQFVFRGALSSSWKSVMRDAREFAEDQFKLGWRFNVPQSAPPPHVAPADPDEPQPATKSANVPAAPDGKTWQTIDAARVVVKPEPGDLVTIEFYAAGHKWPDLKANKWKIDRAQGLLKHVTSHDVHKPADLSLSCTVYYLNGKEKADKPGEFWKDVCHVRPDNF